MRQRYRPLAFERLSRKLVTSSQVRAAGVHRPRPKLWVPKVVWKSALGDLFTGRLSLRRLGVLVRQLSGTSRLAVAVRGGADHDGWDTSAYLLAGILDAVQANTHALIQINSRTRIRPPRPVRRPGTAAAVRRTVRVADLPGARAVPPARGTADAPG